MSQREPSQRIKMRARRKEQSQKAGEESSRRRENAPVMENIPPLPTDSTPLFNENSKWEDYTNNYSKRALVSYRFARIPWLETVSEYAAAVMRRYNLEKLLNPCNIVYPTMVRAFYTTLNRESRTRFMVTEIRNIRVVFRDDLWEATLGLKNAGDIPTKAALENVGIPFNKVEMFKSMMKRPDRDFDGRFSVTQLKLEWRIIHYLLTWIILPRGSNHARISEDDLILMWFMQQGREINWVKLIEETMFKMRRRSVSALPYAAFISVIIHKKSIPHAIEPFEPVKAELEFQDKHIRQMGYDKRDNVWVEKGTPAEGAEEAEGDDAEEDDADENVAAAEEEAEIAQPVEAEPTDRDLLLQLLAQVNSVNYRVDALHDKVDYLTQKVEAWDSSSDEAGPES